MTHAATAATAAAPPAALPFEERHHGWLLGGDVRTPAGAVLSWANPAGSGFEYPEAMGLLLSLHAEGLARGDALVGEERLHRDGAALAEQLAARVGADGAVVHGGARYAFDTAIVVTALHRWQLVCPPSQASLVAGAVSRGRSFLLRCLAQRTGQLGAPRDGHWSREFGPHLLKLALALDDPAPVADLVPRFLDECWTPGWFTCHPGTDRFYPHAHAYALEGLAALEARGITVPDAPLRDGLRSLISVADRVPTDVVAQTARLASLCGRIEDTPPLLQTLRSRASAEGGIRYQQGSTDRNSWVTVFGLQALRWARIGADAGWLA